MANHERAKSILRRTMVLGLLGLAGCSFAWIWLTANPSDAPPRPPTLDGPADLGPVAVILAALVSLLTTAVSLAGLLLTNLLSWRKDRREADLAEINLKIRQAELIRLERELAHYDQQAATPGARSRDSG